jgi:glucosamine--fructose-6-phosphate aminotransferase (isomerizing)
MCGIVGACAQRSVEEILLNGLQALEYRGYDSAGLTLLAHQTFKTFKETGKVARLADSLGEGMFAGTTGIAHTRWATHGKPSAVNAHPHHSHDRVAIVHNGIIENYMQLRQRLQQAGYMFVSDTDSEVIAHLIHASLAHTDSLLEAVHTAVAELIGTYGLVAIDRYQADTMVAARSGSPMVIGHGIGENFIASDQMALAALSNQFTYLEEGDIALIQPKSITIFDDALQPVVRKQVEIDAQVSVQDKAGFRHFMLKEIHEQPHALRQTLRDRLDFANLARAAFGDQAPALLAGVEYVQIVACGTSYHAGLVAQYWLEDMAKISCRVEIASEFRYRNSIVPSNCLFVTISQSGETADTLEALRLAKKIGYQHTLSICNVATSSIVRESSLNYMMRAGTEIGVASTKAFTVQLTGLLLLTGAIAQQRHCHEAWFEQYSQALKQLPQIIENVMKVEQSIADLAEDFSDKQHALFLGRGEQYPIAMEGALKLKEISYIHAEAYAAGELKHGPLALIDHNMPVIVVAPNNELLEKLKSNIQEVQARGGVMYVFADQEVHFDCIDSMKVIRIPHCETWLAPLVYTIPLQLLSYYVALIKGTDIDQPRNLAKSVTVE